MGGGPRSASTRRAAARYACPRVAVRVLRTNVNGGVSGSGDVAGVAAGDGRVGDLRPWGDFRRVLRCRVFTSGAVGAAAAGGGIAGAGARSGPRFRCGGGRGVRAGVHRPPVPARSPHCWPCTGVAVWLPEAGGPVDLTDPNASGVDAGARRPVAAGGGAVAAPDPGGDDRAGGGAGPVPGRSAAVRVSAGGRWAASESGARGVGAAAAAAGSGSGDRAACAVDLRRTAGRAQCGRDRSGAERARCAVSFGRGPRTEPTPQRAGVEPADCGGDPGEPALYRQGGLASPPGARRRVGEDG